MKVFISHSSHDKWVARQMSRLLEADGHSTFLDEKDIKTGDSIDASIQKHLADSDHVVLLLSPASITSLWVFIELGGAKALGKRIVPITFHLGANEIPPPISQLLARDINDFDAYLAEIRSSKPARRTRATAGKAKQDLAGSAGTDVVPRSIQRQIPNYRVGDRVRIVDVEWLTDDDKAVDPVWVPMMDKFSGASTEVVELEEVGPDEQPWLKLAIDSGEYSWAAGWVSKIPDL